MGRWLSVLLVLAAAPVAAHRFEHPKTIQARVQGEALEIVMLYDLDPGRDSQMARALFDRDDDGALSDGEQAALVRYLEQTALLFFELEIDGHTVTATRGARVPHRADRPVASSKSLGLRLHLHAPVAGAAVRIRLRDRDKDRARHVPVQLDLGPGWVLAFASQGEWVPSLHRLQGARLASGRDLQLTLRREAEPQGP